jgi:hypothetical protein
MILPLISDGKLAMSEFGDLMDLAFAIVFLLLLLRFVILVIVRGRAVVIRNAHVDVTGVFTGPAAIWGHTTSPAHAVAGSCSIHKLQGFVLDVRI